MPFAQLGEDNHLGMVALLQWGLFPYPRPHIYYLDAVFIPIVVQ
jgi:hypothetical protein